MFAALKVFVILCGLLNLYLFFVGIKKCKAGGAYTLTKQLGLLGIFCWGDAVTIGAFWFLASFTAILIDNTYFTLLIISVFWLVRSAGETIYWFNQQFSGKIYGWNKPETLPFHNIFKNDSIWFIMQTAYQIVTVISLILTIFLSYMWLNNIF